MPPQQAGDSVQHEQRARVLGGSQSEVTRVGVRNVRCAQEIECESADAVPEGENRQQSTGRYPLPGKAVQEKRQREQQQGIVQAEIMTRAAGEIAPPGRSW